jgi:parvulin-like peptidyl-prolyl isomerase
MLMVKAGFVLLVLAGVLAAAGCGGGKTKTTASTAAGTTSTSAASTTTGSSVKLQPGDVAVVGTIHITKPQFDELISEAKANYASQGQPFPAPGSAGYESLVSQAVTILVQQAETTTEAGKLGITVTDQQVDNSVEQTVKKCCGGSETKYLATLKQQGLTDQEIRDNAKANLYGQRLAAKITQGITVPASEITAYYSKHPSDFVTPPSRDVRYILLGKSGAALAVTLDKQLTGAGRATWCTLAKKYSQDPSTAKKCGEATFTKGQTVPAFDKLLFSLATNQVAKLSTPQYGWFVLEPTANATPQTVTPLAKAVSTIKTKLLGDKKQAAITAWTKKTQKAYCAGEIAYGVGYQPSPDPCD